MLLILAIEVYSILDGKLRSNEIQLSKMRIIFHNLQEEMIPANWVYHKWLFWTSFPKNHFLPVSSNTLGMD